MKTIGIIAEYNPFHNGHRYHIETAKKQTNADYVIVILSGNYVQRGEPAITNKYSRTKMALENGADLVFELPVAYATASAEGFAFGAISLLHSLGFVDAVCFGCETPSLSHLETIVDILSKEPDWYRSSLQNFQKQGLTFPLAREKAILSHFSKENITTISSEVLQDILSNPNNILALEYMKALKQLSSPIKPVAIQRKDAGYHCTSLNKSIVSATAIRTEYNRTKEIAFLSPYVPANVISVLKEAENHTFPVLADDFSHVLSYKLLFTENFTEYGSVTPDFSNRIKKCYAPTLSFTELAQQLKSKNTVYTGVCRNLLQILLNLKGINYKISPPYLRLLGFKKSATKLLNKGKSSVFSPSIPIITKVSDYKKILSEDAQHIFEMDIAATHLYNSICFEKFGYAVKQEEKQGPVIVP